MKKVIRIYAYILLGLIFLVLIFCGSDKKIYSRTPDKTVSKYDVEYEMISEGVFQTVISLPGDTEGLTLAFPTYHFGCEVDIGEKNIYQVKIPDNSWNHSTGLRINFIQLKKDDSGKPITITMKTGYKNYNPKNYIYLGNETAIYKYIAKQSMLRFVLGAIILVMGILLFLYSVLFLKLKNAEISMIHFSAFSVSLALWAMLQSDISNLMPAWYVQRMIINHYMLMLMPITFILFIKNIYMKKSQHIWSYCIYLLGGILIIRTVLQFIFGIDLRETLPLTHLGIVIFAFVGVLLTIREALQKKLSRWIKINLICVVLIMFSTAIELGYFVFTEKRPAVGMIGFLIYVFVITTEFIKISNQKIEAANKAELYRDMAYFDDLTKVHSRTAFRKHMKDCDKIIKDSIGKNEKRFVIFMFDLNDLKKCNDNFGHEYGDRYLMYAANALKEIFGEDSGCYRIGGDEFCVIMLFNSVEEIERILSELKKRIDKINEKGFVVEASVACGYAVYDKDKDENLEQTMARADEMMYINKFKMKDN